MENPNPKVNFVIWLLRVCAVFIILISGYAIFEGLTAGFQTVEWGYLLFSVYVVLPLLIVYGTLLIYMKIRKDVTISIKSDIIFVMVIIILVMILFTNFK